MNPPARGTFTEVATFDGPDGPLAYRRGGAGSPLVLLHSLALSSKMWEGAAAEFMDHHEVFALDVRGHGLSGWSGQDFSVEELVGDVVALFDHLSLDFAAVLGLSMGGSIALALAGLFPARVTALVGCDTTAWYGAEAPAAWHDRAIAAAGRPRFTQINFQVDRWFSAPFVAHHPEVVAQTTGIFCQCAPAVHAAACRALGAMDSLALLGSVTAPTLMLTGRDDQATPPEMGQMAAAGIPEAQLLVVPAKHFAILESAALRRQVVDFLAGRPVTLLSDEEDLDPCCAGHRGAAA